MNKRLLKIDIEVGDQIKSYIDLDISATGSKSSNEIPNEFNISISNLSEDTRNKILTETNVLDRQIVNKKVYVYAGRESTGYSLIYFGGIRMVSVSQPPNIKITLQTFTGELQKVETSIRSGGELIRLSVLSQQIANGLGLNLIFEASDRNIGSYSYSGSKLKEVEKLNELININAYIDDNNLVVRNKNTALSGYVYNISQINGMVGIPEINERGIMVKTLFNNDIKIGGTVNVESSLNPNANGSWLINRITYDLQNRGKSFYISIDGIRNFKNV
jgi:hypothetical protein